MLEHHLFQGLVFIAESIDLLLEIVYAGLALSVIVDLCPLV